jgi:hypothetical protein
LAGSRTHHLPVRRGRPPPRDPRWIRGQLADGSAARRLKGPLAADAPSEVLDGSPIMLGTTDLWGCLTLNACGSCSSKRHGG